MPRKGEQSANVRITSAVTEQELIEESESKARLAHAWAFDHDSDTDDGPAVADQIDHLSVVADPIDDGPAVADQVEDPQASSSSQGVIFMKPKPKVKSTPAAMTVKKLYVRGAQPLQLFNLDTDSGNPYPTGGTTRDIRRMDCEGDKLPCRTPLRPIEIATYTIGRQCKALDLARTLGDAGFEVVVLVFTSAVCKEDYVHEAITSWVSAANGTRAPASIREQHAFDALGDKRVVQLGCHGDMFAVLHEGKVRCATFEECAISCCGGDESSEHVHFGTLTVHLRRAPCDQFVRIGVTSVQHRLTDLQIRSLSEWIILHRLAVLTGFIGFPHDCQTFHCCLRRDDATYVQHLEALEDYHGSPLMELARCSGAIGSDAMFQWINMELDRNGLCTWTVPTPFLFFGYFTKIKTPKSAIQFNVDDSSWVMGDDIEGELVCEYQQPQWPLNEYGNAYVPRLGTITLPQVDWSRWIDGCFQTWVRIGKLMTTSELNARKQERGELREMRKRRRQA